MPAKIFETIDDLKSLVGTEVYVSDWLIITQERVDLFAKATDDYQWIHVDVERAKRESPFGGPVAHGFLTLSLLAKFGAESVVIRNKKAGVNYGLNKVRFVSPVLVGAKIRSRGTLASFEPIPAGAQIVWNVTVDIEGGEKPACIAESVSRLYY
jgi:acyl dehydratase